MDNKLIRQITGQPWVTNDVNELMRYAFKIQEEDDESCVEDKKPMVNVIGNIALVNISGIITNADVKNSVSVSDIKTAIIEAVYNTPTDTVVLLFDSGGGSSSGIPELADYIYNLRSISSKTIISYTDTIMASGALWLGIMADGVYCSNNAVVGSMGVISITFDFEEAYKLKGITPHVFTTGNVKGAGGPVGGHNDAQMRSLKSQVERLGEIFANSVQKGRGLTDNQIEALKDAHTSIGADAVKDGLVDGIMSLEDLLRMYLLK